MNCKQQRMGMGSDLISKQYLSQKIEQDVAGCSEFVNLIDPEHDVARCHYVPPEQKCQKCQGKLEVKRWLE